jgi:hypothetical protein
MTCSVCSAPALPYNGACVFCRAPLEAEPDPTGLLDYLAARLSRARARRSLFRRGPVRSLQISAAGRRFRGRLRKARLELDPDTDPAGWCEELLSALRFEAVGDHDLRQSLSRSGWDFAPR